MSIIEAINFFFFLEGESPTLTNITNKCVIRKIMYVCKSLLNLDCKDAICFGICKMKAYLGRLSPSHFLQNVLIETSCGDFKSF